MTDRPDNAPFESAIAKLSARGIMPTALSAAEIAELDLAIRETSFFSSRVESSALLQSMRDYLTDYLALSRAPDGALVAQGRAEFVANMREAAIRLGLGKVGKDGKISPVINERDVTDIRSIRRLQLVFDTQVESSFSYGQFRESQDPAILKAFPCQRFLRVRPVQVPRPYHAQHDGDVRRKDDLKFWLSMNRDFRVPWGPWGYGSGMGVEDVGRREAIRLGVIPADAVVSPLSTPFAGNLSAGVKHLDKDITDQLSRATGGTLADGTLTPR